MEPITHGPVSRLAYRLCKCSVCGTEATCTPSFDFYTRAKDPEDGPLYCYGCLIEDAGLPDGGTVSTGKKEYKN